MSNQSRIKQFCNCSWCLTWLKHLWNFCCPCFSSDQNKGNPIDDREYDSTSMLHQDGESGITDYYSEAGIRHDSFTSGSLSMASSHSGGTSNHHSQHLQTPSASCSSSQTRDLKELHYEKIEARRASSLSNRKESTAAGLIDLKSIDFWSGTTRETIPVQPKILLSPGRRDTIASHGSADQIRPDLYGHERNEEGNSTSNDRNDAPLGQIHYYLSYDINSKCLMVRLIEAKDLPKPIQLDPSKTDQAHSNPYVKICLLPNQKDSRQTTLRKKTQNPNFEETFSFEIPFRELQKRTLQLLVKDFDKYSRHRVIGQVLLPCAELNVIKGLHFWTPLQQVQSVNSEDLGEILFSLCHLPAAGRLNVDILRCKQLLPTDLAGGAAPYVRVSLVMNGRHIKTKKTSYKKYTLDPVFNESLSFDVNAIQLAESSLVISVLDFNGGVIKDNFIGRIVLGKEASGPHEITHWKNMIQSQRTAVAQWHSLKSKNHCNDNCAASRAVS